MRHFKNISTLLLALILGLCYGLTLAPLLSWANGGADGGDFISAAFTGGVPHPAGYPLYLFAARLFQFLPLGSLAFRTNLLSAACTLLAALILQAWLTKHLAQQKFGPFSAGIGGLTFGLTPLVWSQAVITEVYGLHSLMVIVFLWGLDAPRLPGNDWTRGLLLGLAASNHLTSLLLIPLLALDFSGEALCAQPSALFKRLVGVLCGLTLYLDLPLRALTMPPVNWGNQVSLSALWWLVSGKLYGSYPFGVTLMDVLLRLRGVAGLLLDQFSLVGVVLGLYGLFSGLPRRLLLASLWLFSSYSLFAITYGSYDSQVYLIPACLAFTIWLAYGSSDLIQAISTRLPRLAVGMCVLLLLGLLARIPSTFRQVDASQDMRAEDFGALFIANAPLDALVIANGDEAVFALWYFHFALKQRPDTVIVAENLLLFDWYLNTLTQTYPGLKMPPRRPLETSDLLSANATRRVCFAGPASTLFCRKD
jgi:hypothetical protein